MKRRVWGTEIDRLRLAPCDCPAVVASPALRSWDCPGLPCCPTIKLHAGVTARSGTPDGMGLSREGISLSAWVVGPVRTRYTRWKIRPGIFITLNVALAPWLLLIAGARHSRLGYGQDENEPPS